MKVVALFLLFCIVHKASGHNAIRQCNHCTANDLAECNTDQIPRNCSSRNSCYTMVGKYRFEYDAADVVRTGVLRGCIECPGKEEACKALTTWLRANSKIILLECNIDCCTGDNCNNNGTVDSTPNRPTTDASSTSRCYGCFRDDVANCNVQLFTQNCTSPSTDSCFRAWGTYQVKNSPEISNLAVVRGCIDCQDKVAACEAITAWLDAQLGWTLLNCDIKCCTGDYCNDEQGVPADGGISLTATGGSTSSGSTSSDTSTSSTAVSAVRSAGVLGYNKQQFSIIGVLACVLIFPIAGFF